MAGVLAFDGRSTYVCLGNPDSLNINDKMTVEVWFRNDAPGARDLRSYLKNIVAHGNDGRAELFLRMDSFSWSYELGVWRGDSDETIAAKMDIPNEDMGQWVHLAGVWDGKAWLLYHNAELAARKKDTLGPTKVNAAWGIGANGGGGDRFFHGGVRDVRLWKVARTQEQIQSTMHSGPSPTEQGLAGWWKLQGDARDSSSSGVHGTVRGMCTWGLSEPADIKVAASGASGERHGGDLNSLLQQAMGLGGGDDTSPDVGHAVEVSLEQLYMGADVQVPISRTNPCTTCQGSGSGNVGSLRGCLRCSGTGKAMAVVAVMGMMQPTQRTCPGCDGRGRFGASETRCEACDGNKIVRKEDAATVRVEPGMPEAHKIVRRGDGDNTPTTRPGARIFVIQTRPHERFIRRGDDLAVVLKLPLIEALGGFKRGIEHLDGRTLCVRAPDGRSVSHGEVFVVNGSGMPRLQKPVEFGDLYVQVEVAMPESLSPDALAAITDILGPGPPPHTGDDVEEATPHPAPGFNPTGWGLGGVEDEDETGEQRGQHPTACAQQ